MYAIRSYYGCTWKGETFLDQIMPNLSWFCSIWHAMIRITSYNVCYTKLLRYIAWRVTRFFCMAGRLRSMYRYWSRISSLASTSSAITNSYNFV